MTVFDPRSTIPTKAVRSTPRRARRPGSGDPYNGMVIPGDGFPDSAKGNVDGRKRPGQYD